MDSSSAQWFKQSVASSAQMNGCDDSHSNAENTIDLTLRLGLPTPDQDQDQNLDFYQTVMAPSILPNSSMETALYSHDDQAAAFSNLNNVAWAEAASSNLNDVAWAEAASSNLNDVAWAEAPCTDSGSTERHGFISPVGGPAATSDDLQVGSESRANRFTLIDVPARRGRGGADGEARSSSSSSSSRRKEGSGGRRRARAGNHNLDQYRRCTNYNCGCTNSDTPMWRRGPLGPKTLCNACGIKYRKEKEKKMKAREDD